MECKNCKEWKRLYTLLEKEMLRNKELARELSLELERLREERIE